MKQIIDRTPGISALTPTELYQQMFDTMNDAGHAQTSGPHCTGTVNGFASECPRFEGILAATDPFAAQKGQFDDSYEPTALTNRFDLASSDGSDCGEYRVIFAKHTSGPFDRNFIIFEGRLPNPSAKTGDLSGCLAVAKMWADLSKTSDPNARADALENFYFNGLVSGGTTFEPVVDPTHYGMNAKFQPGGSNHGQIRTNMFMIGRTYFPGGEQPPSGEFWQLREFQTREVCDGGDCDLEIHQVIAKNNPDASLFAKNPTPGSLAETFQQTDFIKMVEILSQPPAGTEDAALIGTSTLTKYDKGESSSDSRQDYDQAASGNTTFKKAITTQLAKIGRSDLGPDDILNRAASQGCGGCHQVTNNRSMGGGITFPSSRQFIHVDESGNISEALTDVFLPHRLTVLEAFLKDPGSSQDDAKEQGFASIGGDATN